MIVIEKRTNEILIGSLLILCVLGICTLLWVSITVLIDYNISIFATTDNIEMTGNVVIDNQIVKTAGQFNFIVITFISICIGGIFLIANKGCKMILGYTI